MCVFITDWENLPNNIYSIWKTSMLKDEVLAEAIHLYLQSLDLYVYAQDIVDFLKWPEVIAQFKLKKASIL
jgi:hypothetical protein